MSTAGVTGPNMDFTGMRFCVINYVLKWPSGQQPSDFAVGPELKVDVAVTGGRPPARVAGGVPLSTGLVGGSMEYVAVPVPMSDLEVLAVAWARRCVSGVRRDRMSAGGHALPEAIEVIDRGSPGFIGNGE